jgi:hypothetical protein
MHCVRNNRYDVDSLCRLNAGPPIEWAPWSDKRFYVLVGVFERPKIGSVEAFDNLITGPKRERENLGFARGIALDHASG